MLQLLPVPQPAGIGHVLVLAAQTPKSLHTPTSHTGEPGRLHGSPSAAVRTSGTQEPDLHLPFVERQAASGPCGVAAHDVPSVSVGTTHEPSWHVPVVLTAQELSMALSGVQLTPLFAVFGVWTQL